MTYFASENGTEGGYVKKYIYSLDKQEYASILPNDSELNFNVMTSFLLDLFRPAHYKYDWADPNSYGYDPFLFTYNLDNINLINTPVWHIDDDFKIDIYEKPDNELDPTMIDSRSVTSVKWPKTPLAWPLACYKSSRGLYLNNISHTNDVFGDTSKGYGHISNLGDVMDGGRCIIRSRYDPSDNNEPDYTYLTRMFRTAMNEIDLVINGSIKFDHIPAKMFWMFNAMARYGEAARKYTITPSCDEYVYTKALIPEVKKDAEKLYKVFGVALKGLLGK